MFAPSDALAQRLTLEYQQAVTQAIPGATAAFSLDPSLVGAAARHGEVTLVGRGPGATHVLVIIGDRAESIQVFVKEPPTHALPGMAAGDSRASETGHYEARYRSDPAMLQGTMSFTRREGDRVTELSLGGATAFAGAESAPFSVPLASYTVRMPGRELTLLDRVVTNSPLTVSRSNVRGVHLREGPWQVHAGYSFFANFEHLLLPTNKESVAGVGYRHRLNPRSILTPNFYYFDAGPESHRSGPLGTLLYEARAGRDVKIVAEIGVSRTVGATVEVAHDGPDHRLWGKLRFAPPELPSLATDQQSGRQIEGGWTKQGSRLGVNATLSSHRYVQGPSGHTSSIAGLDLRYQLDKVWTIHGGPGYSAFDIMSRPGSRIHSVTLPAGVGFATGPVGVGLDYQFSRETSRDLAGHLIGAHVNGVSRGFHFSVNGQRQSQAPTAGHILAQVPWLQQRLDQLGLTASTPQQLAELLRTNAALSTYGYANNVAIDVTPVRTRWGASVGWSGSSSVRPQLFVSTLINRDELIDRTLRGAVHTVSYSQKLGSATDVFFTGSVLCSDRPQASSSCRPVMSVSLRRVLNSAPRVFLPQRHGDIQGTVFRDDQSRGIYTPDMPPLAGVEVVLDGVRRSRTDGAGRFRFGALPYGTHRVEVRYAADEPFFFTTPSPAEVDTGATVNFGIGVALSSLRGAVRNDAGIGLSGLVVHIGNADRRVQTHTADDGTFVAQGLPAGTYDVSIAPGSVPAGYPLDSLAPQRIVVERTAPGRAVFVIRPYRTVSGRVRLFDPGTGNYMALPGTAVQLPQLQRQCMTDVNGLYVFRDLPPGDHTVVVTHNGQEYRVVVSVPDGTALLKDVDIKIVPAGRTARRP